MPNRRRLLEMALKGLEADRAKLDDEIADVKRELGQSVANTAVPTRKKRRMSAEARRKISEAMTRRYAEMRKSAKPAKK